MNTNENVEDNLETPKINTKEKELIKPAAEVPKPKKETFKNLIKWLRKNKNVVIPVFLVIVIIGVVAYYKVKLSTVESNFIIEKNKYEASYQEKEATLIHNFNKKIDSVNLENAYRISKVFSWSVKGELMRGNVEQVGLLLNQFIKTPGIERISLIRPLDYKLLVSTDKKVEGEAFADLNRLQSPSDVIVNNQVIIPILGLSETIGYLDLTYNFVSAIPVSLEVKENK